MNAVVSPSVEAEVVVVEDFQHVEVEVIPTDSVLKGELLELHGSVEEPE